MDKLVPPTARASLAGQRTYWERVAAREPLVCPYSGRPLDRRFALDHVIPWSFVAHDRLWNLVPADPSSNSSKSDWIPSDQVRDRVVDLHLRGLRVTRGLVAEGPWERAVEPYLTDLHLEPRDLLNEGKVADALASTYRSLADLALRQGFGGPWSPETPAV